MKCASRPSGRGWSTPDQEVIPSSYPISVINSRTPVGIVQPVFSYMEAADGISYLGEICVCRSSTKAHSMMLKKRHLRLSFLCLLLLSNPSHAHHGTVAVAIAVPVEGIVVDEDLSDWPEGMKEYPIEHLQWVWEDHWEIDPDDFQGDFRVGYHAGENALYLAVKVQDASAFVDTTAINPGSDECTVYIATSSRVELESIAEYTARGNACSASRAGVPEDVQVQWVRNSNLHQYEWRVDIGQLSERSGAVGNASIMGLKKVYQRSPLYLCRGWLTRRMTRERPTNRDGSSPSPSLG